MNDRTASLFDDWSLDCVVELLDVIFEDLCVRADECVYCALLASTESLSSPAATVVSKPELKWKDLRRNRWQTGRESKVYSFSAFRRERRKARRAEYCGFKASFPRRDQKS